jgi:hypothetical protein
MVELYNQGPGPLISALYDQLRIGRTIDEMFLRQLIMAPLL